MILKLLGNTVKVSPAVLGASLVFASSTHAAQVPAAPIFLNQTTVASSSEASVGVKPTVESLTQLPEPTVITSRKDAPESVPDKTAAITTSQAAALVEQTVEPLPKLPQTTVKETPVSQLTPSAPNPSLNLADSTLAQQLPATGNTKADDSIDTLEQINRYSNEGNSTSLNQVTNVSQLRDVSPGDWAYEALRSLVERYGCIAGYPDGTYRGNRAMSRYEFAAGLNACLQQVERLIASNTADFVRKEDLATLQRLLDEYKTELTTLGARVDKLEGRTAFLENHQFSTTTKLVGEAIFNVADLFGGKDRLGNNYSNTQTVFDYRVRLNFDTSFTGKDLLRTRLQAANITEFGPLRSTAGNNPPGSNITREGRFGFQADTTSNVQLEKLFYRFPVANQAVVYLFANAGAFDDFVPVLDPGFDSSGTGALSRFGRYSPIYKIGGQSQGVGLTVGTKSPIRLDLAYLTDSGSNPSEKFGLFDGNYSALAQLTFKPSRQFSIAATYVNNYDRTSLRHSEGSIASQVQTGRPVVGQSYGVEASYAFTPQLVLSGWGAYTKAIVINTGQADVWTYGATLAINDIGLKGSTLGFVVGMEPKLTGSDSTVASLISGLPAGRQSDRDTGLHIEGFYKFRLTPNILITPGIIWLTAPGHNNNNDDIVIGTIRTTFTF